jgi:serine/threonine-protein kinase
MAFPSVASASLVVGQELAGKYRIGELLGEGGMGTVFAATHLDLDRAVAIKVLREELGELPELVARLMQEARAAARIHSEHVCRVLDVGRLDSGAPYIVMEYLQGADLGSLLATGGPLGEAAAVDYLLEACEAVAEAHAAGIIHRDLKPENLFLAQRPDGNAIIKVLDFGISKATGEAKSRAPQTLTRPSSALGSPHFMAPEQMSAAHDADARADIWALGAILYQLVTGAVAFDGDSLPAVCAAVLESNPVPVRAWAPQVTPELEAAIHRCLRKNREERFRTVAELALAIAPFGTTRATTSLARITRLLGGEHAPTEHAQGFWPSTPPDLEVTPVRESSSGNGSLMPVSSTDARRKRRRRAAWVIGVGAPGVAAAVAFGVLGYPGKSPQAAETNAAPSATGAPVAQPPSVAQAAALVTPASAPTVAPSASVVHALPSRSGASLPIRPAVAASAARAPSPRPPSPWNPDSFGGRR